MAYSRNDELLHRLNGVTRAFDRSLHAREATNGNTAAGPHRTDMYHAHLDARARMMLPIKGWSK
jgi:recombinational DNA repair ATPase RecF